MKRTPLDFLRWMKRIKGKTIEHEGVFVTSGGTFENCTFISHVPKEMCFKCKAMFEAYLVDNKIWNKLPETLRNKYVCPICLLELTDGREKK